MVACWPTLIGKASLSRVPGDEVTLCGRETNGDTLLQGTALKDVQTLPVHHTASTLSARQLKLPSSSTPSTFTSPAVLQSFTSFFFSLRSLFITCCTAHPRSFAFVAVFPLLLATFLLFTYSSSHSFIGILIILLFFLGTIAWYLNSGTLPHWIFGSLERLETRLDDDDYSIEF